MCVWKILGKFDVDLVTKGLKFFLFNKVKCSLFLSLYSLVIQTDAEMQIVLKLLGTEMGIFPFLYFLSRVARARALMA